MRGSSWASVGAMVAMSHEDLATIDPVVMNLVVAQGVPALADLDIGRYIAIVDAWADDLRERMRAFEPQFFESPNSWDNDLTLFRLGLVCWFVDEVLGVAYREDQRNVTRIRYTDPTDLFLNGVIDTRRGTCANLALLNVVLGRRVGLPVSLACVASHYVCRYDDGTTVHNIETTETGRGGFSSQRDEVILEKHNLPRLAQDCGSDLRLVTPHQMLGLFLGLRARHYENTMRLEEAEADYLFARYLFPRNRWLYVGQHMISVQCSMQLFEPDEPGHPIEVASWMQEVVRLAPWRHHVHRTERHAQRVDLASQQNGVGQGTL